MRQKCQFYSFLDARRKEMYGKKLRVNAQSVADAESEHYRTIAMQKALARGKHRKSVVAFLEEMNGMPVTNKAFSSSGLREEVLRERRERVVSHLAKDRATRDSTKKLFLEFEQTGPDDCAVFHDEASTHYEILNVSPDASHEEIRASFRRMAKQYHPDKRHELDSAFIFRRLQEAKDVLLCATSRAKYDEQIGNKAKVN